jgi:hypothetical protein
VPDRTHDIKKADSVREERRVLDCEYVTIRKQLTPEGFADTTVPIVRIGVEENLCQHLNLKGHDS